MAKSRTVLKSNFGAVKRASHEALREARDRALDTGEDYAERSIERLNNRTGYNLETDIEQERDALGLDGAIKYPQFYGVFFEYGTPTIAPSSFMRPAHRAMKKRFIDEADDNFEGWIRRRAGIR